MLFVEPPEFSDIVTITIYGDCECDLKILDANNETVWSSSWNCDEVEFIEAHIKNTGTYTLVAYDSYHQKKANL